MSTEYININTTALDKLTTKYSDTTVYLIICRHSTFKHQVFGIYKHQSYTTLQKLIENRTKSDVAISTLQRSIKRLEKLELIKVLHSKKELIISLDYKKELKDVYTAIESNVQDFNIYADRIKELEENLSIKLNIKNKPTEKINATCGDDPDCPF